MLQELFRIPGLDLPIYGYGVMLVIGFLLALEVGKFLARRVGLNPEIFVNAGLIALVSGVIGARLSHVIENWPQYTDSTRSVAANFLDAVNIRSGGLTFYGGLILAFPILIFYAIKKRVPVRLGMDIVAPCIMVGLGIGRVGCFLNGCCYGAQCDVNFPMAVSYPFHSAAYVDQFHSGQIVPPAELTLERAGRDPRLADPASLRKNAELLALARSQRTLPVHASQLYSTFTALLIAGILVSYFSLRPAPGRVMALMLILEGATRFLLELLRSEPPVTRVMGFGWSLSMFIGAVLVIVGAALWFAFAERRPHLAPAPAG